MFQLAFAIITACIAAGSFAERMKLHSMLIFFFLWHCLVYCPVAHMNWHPNGILRRWGVLDFAGGNVVHIGSSGSRDKSITSTFKLDGDDCPSRVDKSNWRGGHTYGDWFSVDVGPCVGAALGDAVEYDHEDKPKLGSKTNTWKAW